MAATAINIITKLNRLIYFDINSSFVPMIWPKYNKNDTHIRLPMRVYMQNNFKFILARPAGNEMKCLTPGSILPKNVDNAPYLLKNSSRECSCPGFIKKYLP